MVKVVTFTEARSFEISKLKNLLENPSNPLKFVIYQILDHDVIVVLNLARN